MEQKSKLMILSFLLITSIGLYAQKGGPYEQRPTGGSDNFDQKPQGGFNMNITGTWNCGELGIMKIKQSGSNFTGTYSYDELKGKVKGRIKGNKVEGTWSEDDGSTGEMEWEISIERKTPNPTHIRGNWKNSDSDEWEDEWVCTK